MLFLVTATHKAEHCAAFAGGQELEAAKAAVMRAEDVAKKLGVRIHFALTSGPGHVFYYLLESDSLADMEKLVFDMPIPQEFQLIPVHHLTEAVAARS